MESAKYQSVSFERTATEVKPSIWSYMLICLRHLISNDSASANYSRLERIHCVHDLTNEYIESSIDASQVADAIARLNEKQRYIFSLHAAGYTVKEIARSCNISSSEARYHISTACKQIKL